MKVFVTQIPHRVNPSDGSLQPAFSIKTAGEFGEIDIMMSHKNAFFGTKDSSDELHEHLKNFDCENDSLLLLGDPALIATACAILGRKFSYFSILRWDKNLMRYTKSKVVV